MMQSSLFTCAFVLASALAVPGCIEASQEPLDYDAFAVPRGNGTATVAGWTITLSRADVALGPFYFCAAATGSSTLCEGAIAEVTRVAVVNALVPAPAAIGRVHGFSGVIQSASYDFGISWFSTQPSPTPAPPLPGGHSMRLEGVAVKGAARVPFTADVDVSPQYQGQNAVPTAPAVANVTSRATRLDVIVDPAAWVTQLDFDALATTLAASGSASFAIAPGTPEHNALLIGIKTFSPPELRWVPADR